MSFGIGIGDIIKLCELGGKVYKNCRDCPGEYKTLTVETRSLTNLLGDIQDKFEKIPESKQQQLFDAYVPCIEVLKELDRLLLHYNKLDTKSKRTYDRITFDPNNFRNLRERLVASVVMLNTFWTSLIHDNQVLILEALESLQRDYRGGHREESIASIERLTSGGREDYENDEAWHQILRDLEDVGISQHQALSYREYIVNWFITAVNEGKLLEERPMEPVADGSISEDLGTALAEIELGESFSGLDIPTIVPSVEISPPSRPPPPIPRPPIPRPPIPHSHPSTTNSLASHGDSVTSLSSITQDVDSDHASLYADPERSPLLTPSIRSNVSGTPHMPVSHTSSVLQSSSGGPPTIPSPQPPPVPVLPLDGDVPPSYFEKGMAVVIDMEWTARQAVAAWYRNDFITAEKHLEDQLAAVERGQRPSGGQGGQPDHRVLKHLLGACASLTGQVLKAKKLFEDVFHGSFLNLQNLDEGDIAAARWLGDLCLHTQEHANAILAYSVAYEGSVARFGTTSRLTRQVAVEIILLDNWLNVFKQIEGTLSLNLDPTNILSSAEVVEKNRLLMDIRKSVYELAGSTSTNPNPVAPWIRPTYNIAPRPRYEMRLSEGFILNSLISLSKWPLAYDPLFSPWDAVQLDRYMGTVQLARHFKPLFDRQIPRASLGDSKKMHYLTKRGSRWLINAVENGLKEMGIVNSQHCFEPSIVCCLNQKREGVSYTEGVEIRFSKLPWRELYGIKVSDVKWATRKVGAGAPDYIAHKYRSTTDFSDLVKGILERAEAKEDGRSEPLLNAHLSGSYEYLQAPSASPYEKRGMYS
ncbi:hypothetical protein yc1106_03307 [Curvularia clavata]|uniref:Uncharacterized protein n=1 Tax=Curvularia clavata TaxID=95742 RepID=A0A9Q8Z856_CURCL|nr:hypothetical protein yc1106_03307 [Curvularia clavata]